MYNIMLLDLINVAVNLYTCTAYRKVREEKFMNLEAVTPSNITSVVRFYFELQKESFIIDIRN